MDVRYHSVFSRKCLNVIISGAEYKRAENHSIWSETKTSTYGKGLANRNDDPNKVTRIGILGEIAVGHLLGIPVDFTYRNGGDEQDFTVKGYTIDVKTASYQRNELYVLKTTATGYEIPVKKDYFLLCFLEAENSDEQIASVVVCGVYYSEMVKKASVRDGAYNAGHKNYVLSITDSLPIIPFIKEMRNL